MNRFNQLGASGSSVKRLLKNEPLSQLGKAWVITNSVTKPMPHSNKRTKTPHRIKRSPSLGESRPTLATSETATYGKTAICNKPMKTSPIHLTQLPYSPKNKPQAKPSAAPASLGAPPEIPPLLRAYCALGARLAPRPVYDPEFRTLDFFVLLDLERIEPRTYARYCEPL